MTYTIGGLFTLTRFSLELYFAGEIKELVTMLFSLVLVGPVVIYLVSYGIWLALPVAWRAAICDCV